MADDAIKAEEFVKFYKAVSQIDPELKKALRKHLMSKVAPIVEEVRQAALAIPSNREVGGTRKKKGQTLGLRASLAAAAKADFNGTGRGAVVHIRISKTRFQAVSGKENRSLPHYMEGRRKRPWRHPVFGNKEVWVEQSSHPFLGVTVWKNQDKFIKGVSDSVEETIQALDTAMKTINP